MKFKTELHCHCAPVSTCANITPEAVVEKMLRCGYSSVVLTNHLSHATFHAKDTNYHGSDDWQEKLDFYFAGIEALRRAANGRLHVLWGVETCLDGTKTDYLIHGLDEAFYRAHPDLLQTDIETLSARGREAGGLFYQAHPFRDKIIVTNPALLDGIEAYNAHPHHDSRNDIAAMWAKKFSLREIGGSDLHHPQHDPTSGILTDAPITTNEQLLAVLKSGAYEIIA